MPRFRYEALNREGQLVAGELEAEAAARATSELESQGLNVRSIVMIAPESPPAPPVSSQAAASFGAPVAAATLVLGPARDPFDLLAPLLQRGLERGKELLPALRAYAAELPAGPRRQRLASVLRDLEAGALEPALKHFRATADCWLPLLGAVHAGSSPVEVLRRFVAQSRHVEDLRRQWWRALAYPFVVLCFAVVVFFLISLLAVPAFRGMFEDYEIPLPATTQMVLTLAGWITSWQAMVGAAIALVCGAFGWFLARKIPWEFLGMVQQFYPTGIGRTTRIGQFALHLADLLDAGATSRDALYIASLSARRANMCRGATQLAREIENGDLPQRSRTRHALSSTLVYAMRAEMSVATRTALLRDIADCHFEAARRRPSMFIGVMEPATMIAVGVFVNAVVGSLFVPLLSLIERLS